MIVIQNQGRYNGTSQKYVDINLKGHYELKVLMGQGVLIEFSNYWDYYPKRAKKYIRGK